ncbi:MAG: phosphotransacetylase family protein [Firmicutes bacterium]|nr:phosphotransacetylase family protein [Bacillota bacterium]
MKSLYVIGMAGSGKTALCVGLAERFREEGLRVSFFKPVGNVAGLRKNQDMDAVLMKDLLGMENPLEDIVLFTTGPSYLTSLTTYCDKQSIGQYSLAGVEVKRAFDKVAANADLVLIEGTTSPQAMASVGLDAFTLARELGSMVLMVSRIANDLDLDTALLYNSYARALNLPVVGNVLNNVPRTILDKSKGVYKPILEKQGFPVLGVIPSHTEITSPTVEEICDVLTAEVLAGKANLQNLVEDVLIGAMTFESALRYFRRSTNKAVVTGGDRSDVALAALETSTSVLILTGGLFPDIGVLNKAEEKGIPVLLVQDDTYTAVQKLRAITRKIKPHDEQGIRVARETIREHCDCDPIVDAIRG